ncbi:unnamed protein product [Durusdinium trenchii]|uniref:Uncharacterized protein n=1 Tax=Durusdinium trenchii TaxID=1381693 RepID=A0ABP0JMX6_9DINO
MACHLKLAPGLQSTAVANFVLKRTEGVCAKNLANLSLQSALTVRCHALVLCSASNGLGPTLPEVTPTFVSVVQFPISSFRRENVWLDTETLGWTVLGQLYVT